jgi:AraC-like DNA-binding protein
LIFFLGKRGSVTGDFDGRPVIYGAGQVVLYDLARPFDATGPGGESETVTVNLGRAPIVAAAPPGADLHGLIFQEAAGRLVADHLMLLVRRLPHMQVEEVPSVVKATVGLFTSCITEALRLQETEGQDRDSRVRRRVGHYIDQNLGAPNLSPEKICDDLGMSRSVLYRAFEPLAGVADYIRTRRLEAVHVLLEDAAVERHISGIARDFGFSNEAHFSRTFRQRYGYSPRHARTDKADRIDELARLVDSRSGPDVYRTWLAQIG